MDQEKFKKILSYPSYAMNLLAKMPDEEIIKHFGLQGIIQVPIKPTGAKIVNYFSATGNSTTPYPVSIRLERFGEPLIAFSINAMGGNMVWYPPVGSEITIFDTPEVVIDPPDKLGLIQWHMRFKDLDLEANMTYGNTIGLIWE